MTPNSRIEAALDVALIRSRAGSCPPKLATALEYAVKPGGARIRPTICLNVAMACGDDAPGLTDAACTAIELIHCGSLVHDDLPAFDDADIRRGKPTIHRAFSEPLAVLTGDTLIIMAFEEIGVAAMQDAARGGQLIRELARFSGMPHGICAGQAWESEPVVDLSAYHRAKTGALFTAATRMGAAAAGEDPEAWTELGARIGEAFQVADDLRDALYDEETLGKPAGQDAIHARPNAVTELGVQGAIRRLDDILSGAISSIPSCPGEAALCEMVRKTAERLTPVIPNIASARTA
ncbi:polyprenyl synthetase family protein [Dinoroseobacter sp. S76]|uniref:polyprenyl synthetase family protein n=1 Tax=Dinoroseobacter sp. S76 TaxID=3415124 RepID=UPI003C7AAFD8